MLRGVTYITSGTEAHQGGSKYVDKCGSKMAKFLKAGKVGM